MLIAGMYQNYVTLAAQIDDAKSVNGKVVAQMKM